MDSEQLPPTQAALLPAEAPNASASAWQQAYDPTYGCFYYYRESRQVCWATCSSSLAALISKAVIAGISAMIVSDLAL